MPDVGQKGTPDLVPLDQSTQSQPQEPGSPAMSQDVEEEQPVPAGARCCCGGTPEERTGEAQKEYILPRETQKTAVTSSHADS